MLTMIVLNIFTFLSMALAGDTTKITDAISDVVVELKGQNRWSEFLEFKQFFDTPEIGMGIKTVKLQFNSRNFFVSSKGPWRAIYVIRKSITPQKTKALVLTPEENANLLNIGLDMEAASSVDVFLVIPYENVILKKYAYKIKKYQMWKDLITEKINITTVPDAEFVIPTIDIK